MLVITLPDGQQVSISVDRNGEPIGSYRPMAGDAWEPLTDAQLAPREAWYRVTAPYIATLPTTCRGECGRSVVPHVHEGDRIRAIDA